MMLTNATLKSGTALALFFLALNAVVLLVPVVVFSGTGWVYDDRALLEQNEHVVSGDYRQIWTTPYWGGVRQVYQKENLHRPLFLSLLAALRDFPDVLRGLVLATHLGVGFLLGLFILRSLEGARTMAALFAGASASVFLLHPANVEVIAQVVGLLETVPTLLGLLALFLAAQRPWLALAVVATAPGWKETGYLWLAFAALQLYLYRFRVQAALAAALCLAWIGLRYWVYGALFASENMPYEMLNPLVGMSGWDSVITRVALVGHYLRLYFFPLHLSSDYSKGTLPLPGYLIQVWTIAGLVFFICLYRVRQRLVMHRNIAIPAALLTLFPCLHILSPALVIFAERFSYAFNAGMAMLLAPLVFGWVARRFKENRPHRVAPFTAAWVAALTLAFVLYGRSFVRFGDWRSAEQLASHDARMFPQNPKLRFNLGVALGEQQRWPEALAQLQQSVKLAPDFPEAHFRLGLVYRQLHDEAKAQEEWSIADRLGYPVN